MKQFIRLNLWLLLIAAATQWGYGQKNHPDGSVKPTVQGTGQPVSKLSCLVLDATHNGISKTHTNPKCIIIKPGYHFSASNGKSTNMAINQNMGAITKGVYRVNTVYSYTSLQAGLVESQIPNLPRNQVQTSIQYLDGLGRPLQTIARQASPQGHDVVNITAYDKYGRTPQKYLPYVATQVTDGGFRVDAAHEQYQFYHNTPNIAHTDYPYATSNFEAAPTGRTLSSSLPGENWVGAHRKSEQKIITNTFQIKRLNVSYNVATETHTIADNGGYYGVGQLVGGQTIDVEGHKTETYTNGYGQTVLKRVQANKPGQAEEYLETYYIYDDRGRLVAVVAPQAYKLLNQNTTWSFTNEVKQLMFFYYYDEKGRVIAKEIPGMEGKTEIVYDLLDRVVLTRTPKQKTEGEWLFTKYDVHNRTVTTGIYTNNSTRASLQGTMNGQTVFHEKRDNSSAVNHYYTLQTFPGSNVEVQTVNYYDDYSFLQGGDAETYKYVTYTADKINVPATYLTRLQGQTTGSKVKVLDGTNTWLTSTLYYDEKLRVIQTVGKNYLKEGIDRTSTQYDFSGKALTIYSEHQNKVTNTTRTIKQTNQYGDDQRLTKVTHAIDGQASETLAEHTYNELGQSITKKLGRNAQGQPLQTINYRYNIQGWMTHINDATLSTQGSDNDIFGMEMSFDHGFSNKHYDGNISGTRWKSTLDNKERAYGYHYDASGRLTQADYIAKTASQNWTSINKVTPDASNELDRYTVSGLQYDANGNILALQRKGMLDRDLNLNMTFGTIDKLTYSYQGNRLLGVQDNEDAATTGVAGDFRNGHTHTVSNPDYRYDSNGNMIEDKNKGITTIQYNHLNLPTVISFTQDRRIEYTYDAIGLKLKKEVYEGATLTSQTYYAGGLVYENDQLQFIQTTEGRALAPGSIAGSNTSSFLYEYHYKDHLGNLRVAFREGQKLTYTATLEDVSTDKKQGFEYKEADIRTTNPTNGAESSAKLTSTHPLGMLRNVEVSKGDVITVRVKGYYTGTPTNNQAVNLGVTLGNLSQSNGNSSSGEISSQNSPFLINLGLSITPNGGGNNPTGTVPSGYLKSVFFKKDGTPVVTSLKMEFLKAGAGSWQDLALTYTAPEQGYVQVFVANESDQDVYFDDMVVEHTPQLIVQENHYYPFGMELEGINKLNKPEHRWKFQGQEEQKEFGLNWSSFKWRNADVALGRFFSVDPLAEKYVYNSTYAFSENHVVVHRELEGLEKVTTHAESNWSVKTNAETTAKKTGGKAQYTPSGKAMFDALRNETKNKGEVESWVNWGHSWSYGLFTEDHGRSGFYQSGSVTLEPGKGKTDSNLGEETSKGKIKTSLHSLFIFASCGACGNDRNADDDAAGKYSDDSFAVTFADNIHHNYRLKNIKGTKDVTIRYKVTVIAATGLSKGEDSGNGAIRTDGTWQKIERVYELRTHSNRQLNTTTLVDSKVTRLPGRSINPSFYINNHKPNDVSIKK